MTQFKFTAPELGTPLDNLTAAISIIQTAILAQDTEVNTEIMFGNFYIPTEHPQTAVALLVALLGPAEDLKWHGQDRSIPDTHAARAAYAAEALEIEAPTILMDRDKGPSAEVMDFCKKTGVSLDFIFRGDVNGVLRAAYRREKGEAKP